MHEEKDNSAGEESNKKEAVLSDKERSDKELFSKLDRLLTEKKPFLEPDLTLTELAMQLRTNTSLLSRIINEQYKLNFNDLINGFRVREVQEKFRQQEHKINKLISIAFDCGFNSKSTFNRAFKKVTGITPKEYIAGISDNTETTD